MVAIYARQSIDKKDSISIDSQIELCKREAIGEEIHTYIDKGFSGKNTDRPQFQALMNDIKSKEIHKVVVYRLDRISRALIDFAKIMEDFNKYNIEFVSTTEKFDTSTPMGKAMLSIVMVFAQLERETIQQRIKDNYYARGKKGFYLGGKPPYGFKKEKTKVDGISTSILLKNELEIDTLTDIFDKYANSDLALGGIVKYLNSKDIPAPHGGRWESTKIARILRNPVYVKADADIYVYYKNKGCKISNELSDFSDENGCYLYGKRDRNAAKYTDITDHVLSLAPHKGVIDSDVFLKCQHRLDSNKQVKNSGKGKHSWLTGLTKCGLCGYAMTVNAAKSYKYFICRGKTSYNACEGPENTIYVDDIEEYVEKSIKEKADALSKLKSFPKKESKVTNTEKIRLIEIDQQIENLIDQMAKSNTVVTDYINDKITKLHNEKNAILQTISEKAENPRSDIHDIICKIGNWDILSFDEKKMIAKELIKKISLSDDKIDIQWRY